MTRFSKLQCKDDMNVRVIVNRRAHEDAKRTMTIASDTAAVGFCWLEKFVEVVKKSGKMDFVRFVR